MRILVLHSAYGLRLAVHEGAQRLRALGHQVDVPDLYDGRVAETLPEALKLRDELGRERLLSRAISLATTVKPEVIVGFSLGGSLAQRVVMRTGAPRRLVLFHGLAEFVPGTYEGLALQAHLARDDAFSPEEEVAEWQEKFVAAGARVEVHWYEGGHLFTDPELPDFDGESARLAWDRAIAFVGGSSSGAGG